MRQLSIRPGEPTMTARQLATFKARIDKQEKEAEQRAATMAVTTLRAKMALKGKKPTASEERQAVADANRKRQAEADRQRLKDDEDARRVPAHRRIAP